MKTIFDLSSAEGRKIDKELRKTSYYKQYFIVYSFLSVLFLLFSFSMIFYFIIVKEISNDTVIISLIFLFSVFILFTMLFQFKRFDLVKQYYDIKRKIEL